MKKVAPLARKWSRSTLLVGHSLGGVLALRLLEDVVRTPVRATVLVASPYASAFKVEPLMHFFDKPIDWPLVRERAGEIIVVHAKDDPLVPYDHALRYREALGAKIVTVRKGGHLTAKTCDPLLKTIGRYLPDAGAHR
jgi:predicted alpha/beta hydrolase family esterase